MRRFLVLLSSLALLGFTPVSPAYAADTTVVIYGLDFPDDNSGLFATPCTSPGDTYSGPPLYKYIDYTSDSPALGDRMAGFDPVEAVAIGPWHFTQTPSTTTVYSIRLNRHAGAASGLAMVLYDPPAGDGSYWLGYSDVTSSGAGWVTIDASGLTYHWKHWNVATSTFDTTAPDAILSTFVTGHGGDGNGDGSGALLGLTFGCTAEKFYFDDFRVGSAGNVTRYDFEEALSETSMTGSPGTLTAGGAVTLSGMPMQLPSGYFQQATLTLMAKPYGATQFASVGQATATFDGTVHEAKLVKRPTKQTTYQWVLPSSPSVQGSSSPTFTVRVRTKVTSALGDATLRKGQTLVLTGRTTPLKAGYAVTLQRYVNGKWVNLKTALTSATGTYRLTKIATTKGNWKVRATVAAGGGNLLGTSVARIAKVS